jgi:hypothetical protein
MKKLRHRLTLLIAAMLLLVPNGALSCQCGYMPEDLYAAVFEGRVERISRLEPWSRYTRRNAVVAVYDWLNLERIPDWVSTEQQRLEEQDRYGLVVTFRVTSSSKGISGRTVNVRTGLWMGDCGYRFETGHVYRVWAYRRTVSGPLAKASGLETNRCTRTSEISGRVERFRSNDVFALAYPLIWTPIILAGMTGLAIGWLAHYEPGGRRFESCRARHFLRGSIPETWVTDHSGDIGNSFGLKGLAIGSSRYVSSSKYPRS